MTELTAGVAIWPVDLPVRPAAAGRLLPGFEARVVDVGTGVDVPPGAPGELWWRSPSAMTGYLGDPAATARGDRRRRLGAHRRHRADRPGR